MHRSDPITPTAAKEPSAVTGKSSTSDLSPGSEATRLKLLVISMLYEPDCVGIAAIASDMCAALADRGHEVTVYTSYPYYPEWKRKSSASYWRVHREVVRNVDVRRYGMFIPSNPSRLIPRLLHEISFPVSLIRSLADRRHFDVVMAYCPLLGTVMFSALRKMLFGDPLWVNVQDIPVEAATASGIIQCPLLGRLGARLQSSILNHGDVWSSISPHMVEQLEGIKAPNTPLHLCPNWLTNGLNAEVGKLPIKVGQGPNRPLQLLYCGTIGKKQDLLAFCRELSRSTLDFRFQIRGHGGEASALRNWLQASPDSRFDFADLLSDADFVGAIHQADWFVIPQKSGVGNSFFPSKLIPSIFVGTPVLAISDHSGPLVEEVRDHHLGLAMHWSELDKLPSALMALQQEPARFHELQRNCLKRAEVYHRDHAIDRLERLLIQLRTSRKVLRP